MQLLRSDLLDVFSRQDALAIALSDSFTSLSMTKNRALLLMVTVYSDTSLGVRAAPHVD